MATPTKRRRITISASTYEQARAWCAAHADSSIDGWIEDLVEMACTMDELSEPADWPEPPPSTLRPCERPYLRLVSQESV